jgi:HK97 family phage major capsid protein
MRKANTMPAVKMAAKPAGLKFGVPKELRARFDAIAAPLLVKEQGRHEINVLDNIGLDFWTGEGVTAKGIQAELKAAGGKPILLYLNSPGGDAFEGVAIYNLLREYKGDITVRVLGMAASAASVIAMAGDTIEVGEAASIMIHSSWAVVIGNRADLRDAADMLDQLDRSVAEVYASRTGREVNDILRMMSDETWMFGQEAIDEAFADALMVPNEDKKDKRAKAATARPKAAHVPASVVHAAIGNMHAGQVHMSASVPGASGSVSLSLNSAKGTSMKPIAQQIADFEAKRAANAARMSALLQVSADEGRTLEPNEGEEYDTLKGENATIDAHLVRLREHEKLAVQAAVAVPTARELADDPSAAAIPGDGNIVSVRSNAPKGIAFARYVKALAMSRGNVMQAAHIAKSNKAWMAQTPQVARVLMTAVEGGDTTTAGWAAELVYNQDLISEFIELLRPQTILGRMTGMRPVPFNVRMGGLASGGTAYWVGQGKAIPASKGNTTSLSLGIAKAAGLMVITDELARSSAPSAEMVVRDDLIETIRTFLDVQFVDPNVAEVANVSPASITNGVTPVTPTGTNAAALRADVQTLFRSFIQNNMDPTRAVWVMETTMALAISMMQNALGQPEFPGININGGTFQGLPVIPSMSANIAGSPDSGKMIILANAGDILIADEGGLTVEASREASIEMTDSPTGDAAAGTAGTTSLVSMFQENAIAMKLVRYINWKKRRSTAVAYIKEAQYVA